MSKVFADTLESPNEDGTVTIGTSANTVTATGNIVQANTVKDSGGNTLWTSDGAGNLSSINTALAGKNLKLLSTQTASGASSVSFTSDIDSTYDVYIFKFIDVSPATNNQGFVVNFSTDSGSNYNVTKTTTAFRASHAENDSSAELVYAAGNDLAQSTAYQTLFASLANGADESSAGEMYLFNPSSSTYVKHFYSEGQSNLSSGAYHWFRAGYCNTTSAVNAVDFKMESGNFDGIIKMYGLL